MAPMIRAATPPRPPLPPPPSECRRGGKGSTSQWERSIRRSKRWIHRWKRPSVAPALAAVVAAVAPIATAAKRFRIVGAGAARTARATLAFAAATCAEGQSQRGGGYILGVRGQSQRGGGYMLGVRGQSQRGGGYILGVRGQSQWGGGYILGVRGQSQRGGGYILGVRGQSQRGGGHTVGVRGQSQRGGGHTVGVRRQSQRGGGHILKVSGARHTSVPYRFAATRVFVLSNRKPFFTIDCHWFPFSSTNLQQIVNKSNELHFGCVHPFTVIRYGILTGTGGPKFQNF
eukprot:1194725-Prorocentrum_minimum.AAC.8